MTRSEAIKALFFKSVLPVTVALILYCIFKSACMKNGELDYTLHKILPVHAAAHKGELHPDRSVMGVIHIAEGFKDCRLVVRLCKLIIHILELDTLRPGVVVQLAQAVRVHLAER